MSPIVFWMLGISFSSAMMVTIVSFEARALQFALAFILMGFIVLAAVRDHRALSTLEAFPSHAVATLVRHMGVLYGWAAMSIILIYPLLLDWSHWFAAFFVMCFGAVLCLFLANVLMRDLAEEAVDTRIHDLVRSIAKAQFAATCVCFGGLAILGHSLGGDANWAAVNVMICVALGLATLSGYLIIAPALIEPEAATADAMAVPVANAETSKAAASGKKPARTFGRARPA